MILGIGIDLCDLARIQRSLGGPGGARFRDRVFTPDEQAYCEARKRGRIESYAARFAAKEAAMKALGTGWAEGVGWHDFEVARTGHEAPALVLHGRAATLAAARGMSRWLVALSHTGTTAIAWVLVEGDATAGGASGSGRRRGGAAGGAPSRPRPRR